MARKKKCPLCDEKPDSTAVMHTHLRNIHGVVSLAVRDRLLKGEKPEAIAKGAAKGAAAADEPDDPRDAGDGAGDLPDASRQ